MTRDENLCPECGAAMISRQNQITGQRFWGCSTYPTCRGTRNTDGEPSGRSAGPGDLSPSERARENDRGRWRRE
jgi:ssDNA-binding Zn-finger/Zn-ribbon topoisomerase 1